MPNGVEKLLFFALYISHIGLQVGYRYPELLSFSRDISQSIVLCFEPSLLRLEFDQYTSEFLGFSLDNSENANIAL